MSVCAYLASADKLSEVMGVPLSATDTTGVIELPKASTNDDL